LFFIFVVFIKCLAERPKQKAFVSQGFSKLRAPLSDKNVRKAGLVQNTIDAQEKFRFPMSLFSPYPKFPSDASIFGFFQLRYIEKQRLNKGSV